MLEPFTIPDDFRAFMRTVAEHLNRPAEEKFLDADDAFQHECGHGGRTFGGTTNYNFTYITRDGQQRWELALREQQIRDIADGTITEVEGEVDDVVRTSRRTPRGLPLCVWGEFRDDAFRIRSAHELADVLDTLHAAAVEDPRMLRLWSTSEDQIVALVWRDECALYVVESAEGYGTSEGDQRRTGGWTANDHDGAAINVPWADCIEWSIARRALVHFAEAGDCGAEVKMSGTIPTNFLMFGDFDRSSVIASRGEPPAEFQVTSLRGMVPKPLLDVDGDWASRVLDALMAMEFLRVPTGRVRDAVLEPWTSLLATYGEEALENSDTAEWLANEMARTKGVENSIVTGGDLQIALRRTK